MFAINGRLKVTLLVVGILVVGLGMYVGFQIDDAEASYGDSFTRTHYEESYSHSYTTTQTTYCYYCNSYTYTVTKQYDVYNRTKVVTLYIDMGSYWAQEELSRTPVAPVHRHTGTFYPYSGPCSNSDCQGGGG
jgi:hypothetical protein